MKLYFSPGACSLAPHIILRESGLDFTLDKLDFATRKTASGEDFSAVNPKGYVPALRMDDGEVLTEGVVMQQYIADQAPGSPIAVKDGSKQRLRVEEWQVFISTELHKGHSPLFAPDMPDAAKAIFRDKIAKRYDYIEKQLADGRAFLTGDQFTIADAYLFTVSNWSPKLGIDLAKWPKLVAYRERVAARPAVRAALEAEAA
jgi:glutathione S-transferase